MPRRNSSAVRSAQSAHRSSLPARPRKSLGQHFLFDQDVLDRIVHEGGFTKEETVLEVGGGTGALTERLARAAGRVISVELDEVLARHLRACMSVYPGVSVVNANVLDHAAVELLAEGGGQLPYVLTGNIPYYITAPIFRHFLDAAHRPTRMVLLVQREVAESIAAPPGKLSLLGVSVQVFGAARVLFRVPARAFTPPPKVESAVVRVDLYPEPLIPAAEEKQFFSVVRAGFRRPRQQIHNAIAGGLWLPPDSAPDLLRSVDLEPTRRAQTLSIEEWRRLATAYAAFKEGWDTERIQQ